MSKTYTILVQNNSGQSQTYCLFNESPQTGERRSTHVYASAKAPAGAQAKFVVYDKYFAVAGTGDDTPGDGVDVSVVSWKPVQLGSSVLELKVTDGELTLNPIAEEPAPGAIKIKTGADFTEEEARKGNFFVGFGMSHDGQYHNGLLNTFMPQPNTQLQIYPTNKWYLVAEQRKVGSIIDVTEWSNVVDVDFAHAQSPATIVQNEQGELTVQKA